MAVPTRRRKKERVPLAHYDDLPRIEHSPWMKRELEHVLLKQELELKSRKNDIFSG